jgi:hypothetical protein
VRVPLRRETAAFAVVLALGGALAALSLRRPAIAPLLPPGPPPLSVEYRFRVDAGRAARRGFAQRLDQLVERLRRGGARIGDVLPEPLAATVHASPLDEAAVARALAGLPLDGRLEGAALRVALRPDDAAALEEAALRETLAAVRARLAGFADPPPLVLERDSELLVRTPPLDDRRERALRQLLGTPLPGDGAAPAAPLPAPLTPVELRPR